MSTKTVSTRIQNKHDLEVNWLKATFVPLAGELIIYDSEVDASGNVLTVSDGNSVQKPVVPITDSDGNVIRTAPYTYERFKIGDGKTPVSDLPFVVEDIVKEQITANIVDDLTTEIATKSLSAKQGVALKALLDELQADVAGRFASIIPTFIGTSEQYEEQKQNIPEGAIVIITDDEGGSITSSILGTGVLGYMILG